MKTIIYTFVLIVLFAVCANSQVTISQEAANKCRDNTLELAATKEKIAVLEEALKQKDISIKEVQETAKKNEADLKDALSKTESALSTATGQLIATQGEVTRQTAIITAMIPMLRRKSVGLINLF